MNIRNQLFLSNSTYSAATEVTSGNCRFFSCLDRRGPAVFPQFKQIFHKII